jgi:hypothetical protein
MIGTIRKHSTWLWAIIIAATVVSFVIFFSPYQRLSRAGGGPVNFGSINGVPISAEEFYNAQREVKLHYFFVYGDWPGAQAAQMGFDLDRETYFRLLLIRKQEELDIHVPPAAAAKVAAERLRRLNRGTPVPLEVFVKQVLNREGLTAADFERFVRHDLGIQQLMAACALTGQLVTPQEARLFYERSHTDLSVEAVFFSASNYLSTVTVTPEAVAQFYTNQMARYRLPDRIQVKYVEFAATNYAADAEKRFAELTNLNEIIEARYQELGTNYFRDAKTPAEAREKIRELLFKNEMLADARKAATEFARALFDREPMRPENLEQLARDKGLTVRVSEPFDRDFGPKALKVPPEFTKQAFALTADEPFAGPLAGSDAVYVIALFQKVPSEIPPLEQIRDEVTADYRHSQAVRAAVQAGEAFAAALTNGLASGKTFSAVCNAARVRPVSVPPFSLSTRELPEVERYTSLNEFKGAAFSTPPGQPSGFVPTRDGGFVVFVREKLPLDTARMNADLPAFLSSLRQERQSVAFNDWFRREADRGLRDTPVFRRPPPGAGGEPGQ